MPAKGQFKKGTSANSKYTAVHKWLSNNYQKQVCEFCGCRGRLTFAHKKGATMDHNRDNFYILCYSCHLDYDDPDCKKRVATKLEKYGKYPHGAGKLNKLQVRVIRGYPKDYGSGLYLASIFGVWPETISRIRKHKFWA